MLLVDSRIVPAGSYNEVRLEFFSRSNGNAKELTTENACRETLWNCILMENGQVEPLQLPGDVPELVIHSPAYRKRFALSLAECQDGVAA